MTSRFRMSFIALGALGALGWVAIGPSACGKVVCSDGNWDQDTEECDDGNFDDNDACTNTCKVNKCGDGIEYVGVEECDDGAENGTDTSPCTKDCKLPVCGNGVVEFGEACDDGNLSSNDACTTECQTARCGDGYLDLSAGTTEECDDGNEIANDGCTNDCKIEVCGDGVVQGTEECDDGNLDDQDACLTNCVTAKCGDGVLELGVEQCDDGNTKNGDGCNGTCQIECYEGLYNIVANGHCYMLNGSTSQQQQNQRSWFEARQRCIAIGAHLLEIASQADQDAIAPLLAQAPAWIGMSDWLSEGSYFWDLGAMGETPLGAYTHWDTNEPNDTDSNNQNGADCVDITSSGNWRTERCDQQMNYICER